MREDAFPEYKDIVIDVYDIDAFVSAETDGQFESHDFMGGAAILLRSDGSGCILDFEAVGWEFQSVDEETEIGIHKMPEKHDGYTTISIIATHSITCTYREIMDNAPVKQMTVDEFFSKRNYNSRCQSNFAEICRDGFFENYM